MKRQDALKLFIRPTLDLFPPVFQSQEAEAMLLAIGGQESNWEHRKQIRGPAKGFYMFEENGVIGVQNHERTQKHAGDFTAKFNYKQNEVHGALEHNDFLSTVFARLLLWTLPYSLPKSGEKEKAWKQYTESWRPGKPHRDRWDKNWDLAWETVLNGKV